MVQITRPTMTLEMFTGKPMRLDLCSVTQGGRRTWSYFSQSFGFMADIDLGMRILLMCFY
jgi:hypothetical protein